MPTQGNDIIRGPYNGQTVYGLGGADTLYWGRGQGSVTFYGGNTGENYDPDPYWGNAGGDRIRITGAQPVNVSFTSTENGRATLAGRP